MEGPRQPVGEQTTGRSRCERRWVMLSLGGWGSNFHINILSVGGLHVLRCPLPEFWGKLNKMPYVDIIRILNGRQADWGLVPVWTYLPESTLQPSWRYQPLPKSTQSLWLVFCLFFYAALTLRYNYFHCLVCVPSFKLLIYCLCECMYGGACMHVWKSEGNLWELITSCKHTSPRD